MSLPRTRQVPRLNLCFLGLFSALLFLACGDSTGPEDVTTADWVSVVAGDRHACALNADGSVWCWGYNAFGQLGDGTGVTNGEPVAVAGGHRFDRLVASGHHACGIRQDGMTMCWGRNNVGELGDSTLATAVTPQIVAGDYESLHQSF